MEQPLKHHLEENQYQNEVAETARWETHSSQKQLDIDKSETDRYNTLADHLHSNPSFTGQLNQTPDSRISMTRKRNLNPKQREGKTQTSFNAIDHYVETDSSHPLKKSKSEINIQEDNQFIIHKNQSYSEEINQKRISNQDQKQSDILQFQLQECLTCGRKFMKSRLQKHSKICSKLKNKREVFNSKLKRIDNPIDDIIQNKIEKKIQNIENRIPKQTKKRSNDEYLQVSLSPIVEKNSSLPDQCRSTAATNKRSNWKITHENFLKSIRSCKVNPNDPHGKSYQLPLQNPDYVFCKFCERRFAPKTASIHIPKCQHIFHRPKPPSQKKNNFLKALNSLDKKDSKKGVYDTNISLAVIRHKKLEPLQITPKQSHLKSIQVAPVSKPNFSIYQQCQTFAGLLKNYQNVETRSTNYSNKQCPYCNRKFGDKAAQRHIPICLELFRKNGPIKQIKDKDKDKQKQSKRSQSSSKLQLNLPSCCKNCGFKFSRGHKYCCNCGKKRGE